MMIRKSRAPLALFAVSAALMQAGAVCAAAAPLSLEKIMAEPDWIGPAVHDPYWSGDGRSVYYSLKRSGSPVTDLHRLTLSDGADRVLDGAAQALAEGPPVFDAAGRHEAFVRHGDVFLRDSGLPRQITRTGAVDGVPQFSADGRLLSFRQKNQWFVHELASGLTAPVAAVEARKDPDAAPEVDDLRDFQLRTFSTLKRLHDEKEALRAREEELRKADATRGTAAFYLGEDVSIVATSLSPDARWLVAVTVPKSAQRGRQGQLTRYVTESGYEEFESERVRVGRNPAAPQSVWLLGLTDHSVHALKTDSLPGMQDDPLRAVREENARAHPAATVQALSGPGKPRGVVVVSAEDDAEEPFSGVFWSDDAQSLALEMFSIDNKDRWIATVDFRNFQLETQHRLSDAAWVNSGPFNEVGWLNDNRTLWFMSEESGFGQLYTKKPGAAATPLTQGRFEISSVTLSPDGKFFYMLTNQTAPYSYDVYRLAVGGGPLTRLTRLEGVEHFSLEQGGKRLLVTHSSPYTRPQLAVVEVGGGKVRELTDTRSAEFKSLEWLKPEIVQIPSSHVSAPLYGKLYRASGDGARRKPAVLFVHGAGYLQDVSLRYSYYFREQMFNNLLVQHGYTVLDIDYRASAGYGRDWRTAIYRQMGTPELEDLLDAKKWLVENAGADPKRFGVYGGSYGGFMTLMALFRAPGEFAAGAALRPVTDWMQYDKEYTSQILNNPQDDPIAYDRSSPIVYADGLRDALLICHGVIDDNVLFEDSMRLYQRLIELHKERFTISPYPLDRHGFTNADSWLDEYKRIFALFEANLKTP